jgi:transposase-like protein
MTRDTITQLPDPQGFSTDPLTDLLRSGAQRLIEQAVEAELAALLGPNAAGLSSTTISRLKADLWDEYDRWQRRDLSTRRFVYTWADGVYFRPLMAEEKQCVLV